MDIFKILGTIAIEGLDSASEALGKLSEKAKGVGDKLTSAGDKIAGVGTKMMPVTTALGGLGIASSKMSMDFEDAMAKVSTIADESQMSIGDMQAAILDLSNKTGIASTDIADNVYNAISAGQETADAVGFVENATKLATAGFTDSASALDVLTTTLNAYGMESKDVTKVSDMLIQTQNMGKTTVGELSSYMGKLIPTAKGANVGLDQVTTAYAKLTANGIQTADSTTYLNSMLNELNKSGTGVSNILKEQTGKSFSELMAEGKSLADVLDIVDEGAEKSGKSFGDVWSSAEAGKAGATIHDTTNKLGDFNKAVDQMNQASKDNATEEAFKKMQTTSFDLKVTLNQLKNTAIELGTAIMTAAAPMIEKFSEGVQKLSTWFSSLDEEQKQTIIKIAALVAAIGPALIVVGKVTSGIGSVISVGGKLAGGISKIIALIAGISGPVLAIVAVVGLLVGAFVTLWNTNEGFRNAVIAIWEELKAAFDTMCSAIVDALNSLGFDFGSISEVIKAAWQGLCDFLGPVIIYALTIVKNIFTTVFSVITGIVQFFVALFKGDWQGMWDAIKSILSAGKQFVVSNFEAMKTLLSGICSKIWAVVVEKFENIKLAISTKLNAAKSIAESIFTKIKDAISEKINAAKNAVHDAIEAIKGFFDFEWKLPELKLPHIKIDGEWDLSAGKIPEFGVEWYAKAMRSPMIMNSPTAFGINNLGQIMAGGEAGSEVVSGTSTLMNMISNAVAAKNAELIDVLYKILGAITNADDNMADNMLMALAGTQFTVNKREFARLVKAVK